MVTDIALFMRRVLTGLLAWLRGYSSSTIVSFSTERQRQVPASLVCCPEILAKQAAGPSRGTEGTKPARPAGFGQASRGPYPLIGKHPRSRRFAHRW